MARMGAARAYGPKVWKTLMSIDISRKQDAKVRLDLFCWLRRRSIDIQGLSDLEPSFGGVRFLCGEGLSSWPSC